MLAFLSTSGILLSIILLYHNARKNPSTIYLALFFFSISVYSLIEYVIFYSESKVLVGIFFINIGFITYLIGPALYWYTRSILSDDSRFKKQDFWHFIPMIIYLIAIMPHLFSPWIYKLELASKIIENRIAIATFNSMLYHNFISVFVVFLSRPVIIFFYILWSGSLFMKQLKSKNKPRIFVHQVFMKKWILVLYLFLVILIISHTAQIVIVNTFQSLVVFKTFNTLQILSAVGLVGLLVSPFFFPSILYGLPQIPETITSTTIIEEITTLPEIENQNSKFEQDYLLMIKRKVESTMSDFQPYLQTDLNLAGFAKLLQLPAHHLAYYFKEELKQPFNDYRNQWRVKHAKKLISDGKSLELTLEAIGLLSGFSSRNAFFTAFKKFEEMTPSVYAAKFTNKN
jgi:AraC-like DNA-binding protein